MDHTKFVEGQGWKYVSTDDLYADAQKALAWYNEKGMKVARPPAMPEAVARYLVRYLKTPE